MKFALIMSILSSLRITSSFLISKGLRFKQLSSHSTEPIIRADDFDQLKDLDLILSERAKRFYAPSSSSKIEKEKCILLSVDSRNQFLKSRPNTPTENDFFSFEESLNELSELVGTAGV